MVNRFIIIIFSALMLSMQGGTLRSYSTVHFKIQYEKNIAIKDIQDLGVMLEGKYTHYKNIFGVSYSKIKDVMVFSSVGRFKAESKSKIFDDGDYELGKIYLVYPTSEEKKDRLPDVAARVVVRSLLEKIPACPEWLVESFSLYAGNDVSRFGDPVRFNIATFTDLGEDYNSSSGLKDVKELYAKLGYTIHFLFNRYGENKVELMLRNFTNGGSIEEVFEFTFNEKLFVIEQEWVKAMQSSQRR